MTLLPQDLIVAAFDGPDKPRPPNAPLNFRADALRARAHWLLARITTQLLRAAPFNVQLRGRDIPEHYAFKDLADGEDGCRGGQRAGAYAFYRGDTYPTGSVPRAPSDTPPDGTLPQLRTEADALVAQMRALDPARFNARRWYLHHASSAAGSAFAITPVLEYPAPAFELTGGNWNVEAEGALWCRSQDVGPTLSVGLALNGSAFVVGGGVREIARDRDGNVLPIQNSTPPLVPFKFSGVCGPGVLSLIGFSGADGSGDFFIPFGVIRAWPTS